MLKKAVLNIVCITNYKMCNTKFVSMLIKLAKFKH